MSSSKRSRRHFTTEQKVAILRRHMVDKVQVSDLCNGDPILPCALAAHGVRRRAPRGPADRQRQGRGDVQEPGHGSHKAARARWKHTTGDEVLQLRAQQLSDRWAPAVCCPAPLMRGDAAG